MRTLLQFGVTVGLVAVGYALGACGALAPTPAGAQADATGISQEASDKVKVAIDALNGAAITLRQENRYQSAFNGINAFAITSGGVNALQDLETGRGVDPETFAALYAGLAVDDVAQHLSKDDQGRLTYKDKVVRLYPISRLKQMFAERARLSGEESKATKKAK